MGHGKRVETAERFGLSAEEVAYIEQRRWNYFLFRDRWVSVHAVRLDSEIREVSGARRYWPLGVATVEATIGDATESLFLPAVDRLADVAMRERPPFTVHELGSYEGLCSHFADPGDRIATSGPGGGHARRRAPAGRRNRRAAGRRLAQAPG